MNLEQRLNQNLTRAVWVLVFVSLVGNSVALYYEIQSLTDNIFGSFILQVKNVARVASQSGDVLSLQRNLESVAEPLAHSFSFDLTITKQADGKVLVFIESKKMGTFRFLEKEVRSTLEVNPFGGLDVKIVFDLTHPISVAALKTALGYSILLLALVLMRMYIRRSNRRNLSPVDEFSVWLDRIPPAELLASNSDPQVEGLSDELKSGFLKLVEKMRVMSVEVASLESQRRVNELARRLAHDIRSPLSALNTLVFNISEIDDGHRRIIDQVSKRINAIASDMLANSKLNSNLDDEAPVLSDKKGAGNGVELRKMLEQIVAEKTIEYQDNMKVSLVARLDKLKPNVAVPIGSLDLSRVISNLMNNSVEALIENGDVVLESWVREGRVFVKIQDNGAGIPEAVLSRLKHEQVSTKAHGSGIGVLSSYELVRSNGGQMEIQSREGIGTQITISFEISSKS